MSGGSLDYVCYKVEEAAGTIAMRGSRPIHRAFADHLKRVAKALHDVEWVFSCDMGDGDEDAAILTVVTRQELAESAVATLTDAIKQAQDVIAQIQKGAAAPDLLTALKEVVAIADRDSGSR